MTTTLRMVLLAAALAAASALAMHSAAPVAAYPAPIEWARPPLQSARSTDFNATFVESRASTTDRIADLGILQLINTGTGAVEGYGTGTVVLADEPGSFGAALRSRELDERRPPTHHRCRGRARPNRGGVRLPTPSGPKASGTWTVDGDASTGAFAGARGSGEVSVEIPTRTATHTGKLKVVHQAG